MKVGSPSMASRMFGWFHYFWQYPYEKFLLSLKTEYKNVKCC